LLIVPRSSGHETSAGEGFHSDLLLRRAQVLGHAIGELLIPTDQQAKRARTQAPHLIAPAISVGRRLATIGRAMSRWQSFVRSKPRRGESALCAIWWPSRRFSAALRLKGVQHGLSLAQRA